jgi:hypothetical protein
MDNDQELPSVLRENEQKLRAVLDATPFPAAR